MSCYCNQYTMNNRESFNTSNLCVCIDCLSKFSYTKIRDWCDNGNTAICPYCWDDTVLIAPEYTNLYTENDIINCHKSMRGITHTDKIITYTDEETYSIPEPN